MAESSQSTTASQQHHAQLSHSSVPPPPAPPLPPSSRSGVLHRIIAPLTFNRASDYHNSKVSQSTSVSPRNASTNVYYRTQPQARSQTKSYRAGFDIAAVDINEQKTHAILAGREILKIVQLQHEDITDELNLRSVLSSSTGRKDSRPEDVNNRRQFLPAKDVRWSHGAYSHIVATAALNGRMALYDVSGLDTSRTELSWLYQHTSQVNKLDFDPHRGYMLLSGSQDKTCKIFDIRSPRSPISYNQYYTRAPIRDVRWSPVDAFEFALCTENGVIQKWDVRNPNQALLSINAHEKACYTIGWHPDGKHLVSGGLDKYLRVWDFKSDNRRQKPVFQLRTPQGIMNLAWRPPCWSSEFAELGNWQSTQIATAYVDDDPRVHVWDFRRPLIPFREIDREDKRPTDMLWATKDLLWTVGSGGIFTQTDMSHIRQVPDQLPPCAMDWLPDGSYVTFAEARDAERKTIFNDATANFLNIPSAKLSGDDGYSSNSMTDEEDTELMMSRPSKRSIKTFSTTRSSKSLGNTPPTTEGFPQVLSLDKAVVDKDGIFTSEQAGSFCQLDGVALSNSLLRFLTDHLALPITIAERAERTDTILERLHETFEQNANAYELIHMHRTAQSWHILQAVLIPELKDWADKNRKERLEYVKAKEARAVKLRRSLVEKESSPFAKVTTKLIETKSPARSEKTISNLFKGVFDSGRSSKDYENSSNMTTPLAKPLPDSPATVSMKKENSTWFTLNDIIEPMPQLPPSMVNAHSTASIASKALRNDSMEDLSSSVSSPENPQKSNDDFKGHKRNNTDIPKITSSSQLRPDTPSKRTEQDSDRLISLQKSPVPKRTQEEMRAALKDYRAQTRPLFSLDTPNKDTKDELDDQHGSADNFLMFSTSTDSSHKEKFWGKSFDTSSASGKTRQDSVEWLKKRQDSEDDTSFDRVAIISDTRKKELPKTKAFFSGESSDFASVDSPEFTFGGMDGTFEEVKLDQSGIFGAAKDDEYGIHQDAAGGPSSINQSPAISQEMARPNLMDQKLIESKKSFASSQSPSKAESFIHHYNHLKTEDAKTAIAFEKRLELLGVDERNDLGSQNFIDIDFRSIQTNQYEPLRPFAWSSLPLICQIIEFDQKEGIACGLFSVHLIMHVHSFFFHRLYEEPWMSEPQPINLAERLMSPKFRGRAVENIFARHMDYLRKMQLFISWAHIRKFCNEAGYLRLNGNDKPPVGSALKQDRNVLTMQCQRCLNTMTSGHRSCRSCQTSKAPCPICESITDENGLSNLWSFCHKCGHTFHTSCMATWLLDIPDAQGQCPVASCMCDCGPGIIRQQRFEKQRQKVQENDAILGSSTRNSPVGGLKKDPLKATHSAAVDRARHSLRNTTSIEGVQSGDDGTSNETVGQNKRRSSWSRTGGSIGFGQSGNLSRHRESSSGYATPIRSGTAETTNISTSANVTSLGAGSSSGGTGSNSATSADSRRVRVITPREENE